MPVTPELLDHLLKDYTSPDDLLGEDEFLQRLTKAILGQALQILEACYSIASVLESVANVQ